MPQDDKAEKSRAIKGEGKAFKQWKYPLPGVLSLEEWKMLERGQTPDRLKALGW